jgi:hypothetical protein
MNVVSSLLMICCSFRILEDGSVWLKQRRRQWRRLENQSYCINDVLKFPWTSDSNRESISEKDNVVLILCKDKPTELQSLNGPSDLVFNTKLQLLI